MIANNQIEWNGLWYKLNANQLDFTSSHQQWDYFIHENKMKRMFHSILLHIDQSSLVHANWYTLIVTHFNSRLEVVIIKLCIKCNKLWIKKNRLQQR